MRPSFYLLRLLIGLLWPALCMSQTAPDLLPYVNPFIGTGGHGHTFPGATAPFGMVQLSPDTRIDPTDWDGCSGYHYSDSLIYGFSHTHLSGTGVSDYCDILFMPFSGGVRLEPEEYAQPFQKKNEHAEAGYYAVQLDRDRIRCQLTATERVGVHQYTYAPNQMKGNILIDLRHRDEVLDAHLEVVNTREVAGYRISRSWAKEQRIYFVARFSRPFINSIVLDLSKNPFEALPSVSSKAIAGVLNFGFSPGDSIVVTVGLSPNSIEAARHNLEAECPHFDFQKIKEETQAKWQHQLAKIQVDGGSTDQKTIFYTALYHCMIAPNLWSDRATTSPSEATGETYTVFSLWDTHRALHPLLTLLEPERTRDFINTFLQHYRKYGRLPVWELAGNETDCMIGNHAIPVIYDAYLKGIRGFNEQLALEAMIASANTDLYGLKWYREMGYVPADKEAESVSKTLEYAYDDWCIAHMAHLLGKEKLSREYEQRSQSYCNLFDPSTRFFRAKKNGLWHTPFDPYEVNFNYTEANAWQYRYSAHFDRTLGMVRIMGGIEGFENQLDSLFLAHTRTTGRQQADITGQIGQYVHGNEPSHHIAYLYNHTLHPSKSQQRVRQIMDTQYANAPDGLSGNEDCGQMSAWLVWSAMGMYPALPGADYYWKGSPWFEQISLHLPNGNTCQILAPGTSSKRYYAQNFQINGQDSNGPFTGVPHQSVLAGATLNWAMSDQPHDLISKATSEMATTLLSTDPIITPLPFVARGSRNFQDKQTIELGCLDGQADILYTLDGSDPASKGKPYTGPFVIKNTTELLYCSRRGQRQSPIASAQFYKIPDQLRVLRYQSAYSPQYTAGGASGLIDGIRGGEDFRTGDWQGFEGQHMDVVLDLGKTRNIHRLTAGFLQDENAWIFLPLRVRFEVSDDGQQFSPAGEVLNTIPAQAKGSIRRDFSIDAGDLKGRYVRVVGESLLKCPPGHKGAGFPCWLFADEVVVE